MDIIHELEVEKEATISYISEIEMKNTKLMESHFD